MGFYIQGQDGFMVWQYAPLMIPPAVAGCVCRALLFIGGRYGAPGMRYFSPLILTIVIWIVA